MNRSQLLDTEQHIKKGVGGREDNISGEIKGKDGSVTTYNPIHPPEDQQRIKGTSTVLGGDNMERETRDRDPVPTTTKMSTNRIPIHAASSPTFPDQEQKPKTGALRQEEDDHKRKAHHDVVPSKVFAYKESGDLAPNQLGEKSTMYRTVNESPSMSKEQPKSTKPNQAQAVDGVLRTGYDLLPSSSKKIDGALSVGDINRDGVSSKEQPKSSDGLKEKPRIENIKMIKQHEPPKDEADHLGNSEIRPRKTIEHPVMHDKEDHSLKEQRQNNFLGPENFADKNGNKYATSNSLDSSEVMNIPEGVPIDKIGGMFS
ncbi:uncharacterized protein LOC121251120 isoform X2 [Juglans microcarpa x Juglans regia]|uniref:uncharacterized protein LOC121251120 isoform X2 n=1 Tax=Juglans microcarpa x Juglans regia TaxID=2249226 RepID=UPI001B7DC6D2|nr:uncharacterized protein LOC121251120 isoform X2 [Juglans microcarpa x Juglans regia]